MRPKARIERGSAVIEDWVFESSQSMASPFESVVCNNKYLDKQMKTH